MCICPTPMLLSFAQGREKCGLIGSKRKSFRAFCEKYA